MSRMVQLGPNIAAALLIGLLSLMPPSVVEGQAVVVRGIGGYGFKDGYDAGFGGSAGIEFPLIGGRPFFLGGRVMYHAGTEVALPTAFSDQLDVVGEVDQLHYGLEFGATWVSNPIILRTSGGIGVAHIEGESTEGPVTVSESTDELVLSPGLIIAAPIDGGRAFIGVEGKWLRVRNFDDAIALYATFGYRFGGR